MKKMLKILTAVIVLAAMCVFFAACSTNVEGNTYTFSDAEVTSSDEIVTEEMLSTRENKLKEQYQGFTMEFQAEGIVIYSFSGNSETTTYYYVQEGNTVYIYQDAEHTSESTELTVSGDTLYFYQESVSYAGGGIRFSNKIILTK